jgi:hypothetical protein
LSVATPTLAQPKQLTVQPSLAKDLAKMIQSGGHDCPEGMHSTFAGNARISLWEP